MYWLFSNDIFGVRSEVVNISWQQKQNFQGEVGDEVIFFEFNYRRHLFTHLYKIARINKRKTERNLGINSISLTLRLITNFGEEKEIEDYIFSFPRIKYFRSRLYRYFNRRYYKLTDVEFFAIVEDRIFLSRTIVGTALNALHSDHRRAFSQLMVERNPDILQNRYTHTEILSLLNEYFQYAIVTPAKQLAEAYVQMQSFIERGEALESISFYNTANPRIRNDSIRTQVNLINEYLEQVDISIPEDRRTNVDESEFESLFRNKPLPIDLND
ncbi:hypothetical protein A3860_05895 [Niastella vici]|uniref:Uncharacterized protein n=1 Tax=Niastella vici TaxID=1703345 RepID=A0A1V9FSC7_9BACT|nr:hypothetical protein [Niastella vici]OQP61243.1 hypothetical protein A3860_05895 [Niastella vici]